MNEKGEIQSQQPQTYRAALEYVTAYLLQHPPTYELEFRDPPRPNYLLDSVMLLREWLDERQRAAHAGMTTDRRGEGWSL
ncbi:MAG TPA: hypothetical protein VNT79_06270 [Phycisphaerae bacterium]|nr:hypothetical protein [Phycisphaerae bacterium]